MIKRIILSLLIIGGVGASAFAGTKAIGLTDTATLSASTFSTGTADLQISNGTTGAFADSAEGFTTSLLPGKTFTKYIRLRNNSTDVDFSIAAQATAVSGSIEASNVTVVFTPVNGSEVAVGSPVSQILANWTTPTGLGTPNILATKNQEYKMDVTLSSSVSTPGSFVFSFLFTGTQFP